MDNLTKLQRSYCMSKIKSTNTKPEIVFRKYVWANQIRGYRVKAKIKGKPDLYFPKRHTAVFIDGCFWHKCSTCYKSPKSNRRYWTGKIKHNILRDNLVNKELQDSGVHVIRFWEHEIKMNTDKCFLRLRDIYATKTKNY